MAILGKTHVNLHSVFREHRSHERGVVAAVSPPWIPRAISLGPATVNASTSVRRYPLLRLSKRRHDYTRAPSAGLPYQKGYSPLVRSAAVPTFRTTRMSEVSHPHHVPDIPSPADVGSVAPPPRSDIPSPADVGSVAPPQRSRHPGPHARRISPWAPACLEPSLPAVQHWCPC